MIISFSKKNQFMVVFLVTWWLMFPPFDYGTVGASLALIIAIGFYSKHSFINLNQILILALIALAFALSNLIAVSNFASAELGIERAIRAVLQAYLFFLIFNISDNKIIKRNLDCILSSAFIICFLNIAHWLVSHRLDLVGQNQVGFIIAIAFAIILYKAFDLKSINFLISISIILISCLLTWSKGSWVVVAILYLSFLLAQAKKRFLFVSVQIIVFAIIILASSEFIYQIIDTEISASGEDGSDSNNQRLKTIYIGVVMSIIYPFGVGTAYEEVVYKMINLIGINDVAVMPDPHNAFLHAFAMGGFIYGFFFLAAIGHIFLLAYKKGLFQTDGFLGFSIFLVIFIYGQFNGIVLTHSITWLILGSVMALLKNKEIKDNSLNNYKLR